MEGFKLLNLCLGLTDGRGLMLVADEGPMMPDEVCVDRDPVPTVSGDIRLPVAFELLKLHVKSQERILGECQST